MQNIKKKIPLFYKGYLKIIRQKKLCKFFELQKHLFHKRLKVHCFELS